MWRKMDINKLADLRPGYLYGNGLDTDVVNFIDNHDNQRDPQRYVMNYNDGIKYAMGVAYMLAWDYGLPRLISSYAFTSHDQGPPNEGQASGYKVENIL
jgi:alpha-amylase